MRPVLWIAVLACASSGCMAAKAGIGLVEAESALQRASEYDAEELATYEYTMARRYLQKAYEEHGYSDYRVADALARQSATWSDRAIIFIERRGRGALIDLRDLSDTVAPPTQNVPPPEEPPPPGEPTDEELFGPDMDDLIGPDPGEAPPEEEESFEEFEDIDLEEIDDLELEE